LAEEAVGHQGIGESILAKWAGLRRRFKARERPTGFGPEVQPQKSSRSVGEAFQPDGISPGIESQTSEPDLRYWFCCTTKVTKPRALVPDNVEEPETEERRVGGRSPVYEGDGVCPCFARSGD
jgi:hypothetical protein